jgi:hypothetical protein
MDAPARFLEKAFDQSHAGFLQVMAGFGQIQCGTVTGTGSSPMASVGQRSTQAPQPVQASRMTL